MKEDRIAEREEIAELRQKVQRLEQLLEQERNGTKHNLTSRLGALEELVDRYKAEMESEVKTAYKGIEGLWHNIGVLQRQARSHDDRIDALIDANQATQDDIQSLQTRIIEVDDASMMLEERVDSLVSLDSRNSRTKRTTSLPLTNGPLTERPVTELQSTNGNASKAWTVHVSLLPKASQPFPFEKDTLAYKRALSRGLHRVIAIPGTDSQSFTERISSEFAPLLQGRPWMPLVAKICDAQNLRGLPMLRQLPSAKIDDSLYNHGFLKNNCATVDSNGNIPDLYIAMRNDTFSWAELQQSPIVVAGLEACWEYDTILDGGSRLDDETHQHKDELDEKPKPDEKPSAGDLLRAWSPPTTRLKRTAAAVSRKSSFGSVEGDSNNKRVKTLSQRVTPATAVEVNGR
jgi:hypothetical protein